MQEEFVPYDIALGLSKVGFDEKCFGCYIPIKFISPKTEKEGAELHYDDGIVNGLGGIKSGDFILAPLYQQVVSWLRKEYNCFVEVNMHSHENSKDEDFFEKKEDFLFEVEVNYYGKDFLKYRQNEIEADYYENHISSYEEALKKGLQKALKLIENDK